MEKLELHGDFLSSHEWISIGIRKRPIIMNDWDMTFIN